MIGSEIAFSIFLAIIYFSFLVVGLVFLLYGLDLSITEEILEENEEYYQKMQNLSKR